MSITSFIGFKWGIFSPQRGPYWSLSQGLRHIVAFLVGAGPGALLYERQLHHAIGRGVFGLMCNIRHGLLINEVL